MLDNILRKYFVHFTFADIRVLRYAFGATLAMAIAMGINWPLSYLTPLLVLSFLSAPGRAPTFKTGFDFVVIIAIASFAALFIGNMFISFRIVFILLIGLLLFRLYYAKGGKVPKMLILWLMITLLIIPLAVMIAPPVANIIPFSLISCGAMALIVTWISYTVFPDSLTNKPIVVAQMPKQPTKEERYNNAVNSTIVVFPILLLFYFFELSGGLLILIYIALLSMQPQFAKDFKSGTALIIGNAIGGVVAIIVYEIFTIVPEYLFMLLTTLFFGLFFGHKLFSDNPKGPLFGMAYSTLLLIIGSVTGITSLFGDGEAGSAVYVRILEIMAAVIYLVVAFGLLEYFKKLNQQKKLLKMKKKVILTALLALALGGCTMGPDFTRPTITETEAELTYNHDFPTGETIADLPWWEMFGDTVLQNLITEALVNNRDLKASMARIAEARATLGIVRADLYPRVDYSAAGSYDGTFGKDKNSAGSGTAALDVSYQVDIWGRIRRSNEAALQEFLATEEAYRGITIALVSEVASAYLLLRDIDNRLLVSEYTAEARRKSLEVIKARFDAGIVSEVDVNQSEIQLADAEAAVKNYERLRAQTENAISMLLSKPPMTIERGLTLQEQLFPPEIPVGLPSTLLNRRPDLLQAERNLHAQTARIGVAEALKYPQLNLSANLGAQFTSLTTGFAGLGAQLFGPLYNAGANQRRVDVEIARTEQLLNKYEQTFYTALREVEDAMIAVKTYEKEFQIRKGQVESAQSAADLSWVRYDGGMTSYLEVLDLQRSLFTAQLKASEALQMQLSSIINLYKALGGGWVPEQDSINGLGQRLSGINNN